ncbi:MULTISPECIES: YjbH domain-containing protein [unclassified Photobacterium]|uniref:YjbH domain-containing protein n=1 Tax=unclassified Photobacterium TaxID=2628852 RepID=UPI001EDD117D|nr:MULTISPECIES: YjbH domain-containing protein [unclassified Photobacterium]MCG3864906.1 YjbH domain-containing protein [Photobacterium sp. Ph6]MCG3876314.1 YjbH domain-containing protein [Photobacterium sp. Ph5]
MRLPFNFPYSLLTLSLSAFFSSHIAIAKSVDNLPSSQSYTGLMFTPNAQVIDTGDFNLSFHQGVPYQNSIAKLDDWFFAAGIFKGLEAGGRIVTRDYDSNCYTDGCGIRDLSASLKYQLPFIYDYTGVHLAVGAQDIGGEANNFDTKYIVADTTFDTLNLRLSAGYGQSSLASGIMNGPFGGAEWQPLSFLQITGEYDAAEFNANAKLFTPENLLPYGVQLSLDYELYTGHKNSDQTVWGINAAVPLLGYNNNVRKDLSNTQAIDLQKTVDQQLAQNQNSSLQRLITALRNDGFINLQIGKHQDNLVIALENRRYNHNPMDGVGVALGIIAEHAGSDTFSDFSKMAKLGKNDTQQNVELIMLTNGIPMFTVNTEMTCYRDFLKNGSSCQSLTFNSYNAKTAFNNTTWLINKINNGFGRSQVIISPELAHRTATEYGFFDYSLALVTNLYTPLWQGAAIDIRHTLPVAESDDFKEGEIWGNSAYDNEINRLFLHQAFKLPQNIMTQFTAGYMYGDYWGGMNETNWISPNGFHDLGFKVSQFRPEDEYKNGKHTSDKGVRLAKYQFSYPDWNWQLELQGGEFWKGDRGIKATSSHWLGDTRLSASYLTSKAQGANQYEDFLTLSISLPLTPWRDMNPGYLQVRGIDQFTYSLQTRVGNEDGHNNLNTGLGGSNDIQHNLARQYQGQSRLTSAYFKANTQRLRNAYIRYVSITQ